MREEAILQCILAVLQQINCGALSKQRHGFLVEFPTKDASYIKAFWARLIICLSEKGFPGGALAVPMVWLSDAESFIWAGDCCTIRCTVGCRGTSTQVPARPSPPPCSFLAIGGPSGVGKTTLIQALQTSEYGGLVRRFPSFTTRPIREGEVDGVDYNFVAPSELATYQNDPRYMGFVQARGNWYWVQPSVVYESVWQVGGIYIFAITQSHEFCERRLFFPDLKWVWMTADESEIESRLRDRGDAPEDVAKSLAHNRVLEAQDRTGLVSVTIRSTQRQIEGPWQQLRAFMQQQEVNL